MSRGSTYPVEAPGPLDTSTSGLLGIALLLEATEPLDTSTSGLLGGLLERFDLSTSDFLCGLLERLDLSTPDFLCGLLERFDLCRLLDLEHLDLSTLGLLAGPTAGLLRGLFGPFTCKGASDSTSGRGDSSTLLGQMFSPILSIASSTFVAMVLMSCSVKWPQYSQTATHAWTLNVFVLVCEGR